MRRKSSAKESRTSIRPDAMRGPRLAAGRSSATASPVTRSSVVSVANSGVAIALSLGARRPRVGAHGPRRVRRGAPRRVAAARGAHPSTSVVGSGVGRAGRALPAGRDPPLGRAHVGARCQPRGLPVDAALPCPEPRVRHSHQHLARRAAVLRRPVPGRALPAALVVAGHARGQRGRRRRDDAVAAGPPRRRAEPALAGRGGPAGGARLRGLLQRVRRRPLRGAGLGQQRLGRGPLHRPRRPRSAGRLAAVPERREPRDHRLDHDPPRPRRALLGPDPPARPARAHGRLRGRRHRAQAVLVVGGAGRADAHPVAGPRGSHRRHHRARAGRGAAGQRASSRRS